MNCKINKIILENYKSFIGCHEFDIDSLKYGLYFIDGKNKVEPLLGSNGSGKSSLSGSMCFCLYGKDENGLRAGNIGTWGSKERCFVGVEYKLDNSLIDEAIHRTWNPNSFIVTDGYAEHPIDDVTSYIGLNYDAFLYSIIIGQFSSQFFDLDPAPKLKVFTSILGLDRWDEYSNKAKEMVEDTDDIIAITESKKGELEHKFQYYTLNSNDDLIEQWEIDFKANKAKLDKSINETIDKLELVEKELKKNQELEYAIESWGSENDYKITKVKGDLKVYEDKKLEANAICYGLEKQITQIRETIKKFKGLNGKCRTCDQDITEEHIADELKYWTIKLLETEKEQENALLYYNECEKKCDTTEIDKLNRRKREIDIEFVSAVKEQKFSQAKIKDTMTILDELYVDYDAIRKQKNPWLCKREQDKVDINVINAEIEQCVEEIRRLEEKREIYKYWIKGFKEIKFMLIDEAVQEFEIATNDYMNRLGLRDWTIKFLVERETTTNKLKKGFEVFVKSPHNKELVPFKAWSGGEQSRLKLSGTLGLSDFIVDRTGYDFDVRFVDEPTQFLSSEGIEDLLELLKEKAVDEQKKIFIVDHRSFSSFDFTGTVTIIKDENGSRIERILV